MKKIMALMLIISLAFALLAGCGSPAKSEPVKTGLAVISSIAKSTDATAEKDGFGQVDSTVVAVTVDKDGKISKCIIDAVQTKIDFSSAGIIANDINSAIKSKNELGNQYNMKSQSKIGKEWNEQASALSKYVVGKTIEEIKGIAVNDTGAPTDAELASSVTFSIGGFVDAIEKAVKNAKDLGAKSNDKLGLGIITTISSSTNATADKAGLAQANSNFAVSTFDANGKVTSCILDASQSNVNFTTEGNVISDLNENPKTKTERGNDYGMKKESSIGKEWDEQANAFAKYVVGKTLSEIKGITVNQSGAPSESELASSVTLSIGGFISVIEKANASAK